ncbi:hypothetical protein CVT24_002497 [Panaeolus cyanescens]|uniref:F-box domain-containing protein n=1 Tax=Panaeolus cyanescens TaxID=181874 RepID=A0A409WBU0_9AGAR|nr:hypothetical protein CVT24_002497 [Panaeolus cyanescens]
MEGASQTGQATMVAKGNTRKRKNKNDGGPQPKKPKTYNLPKGFLKEVVNVPFDILCEIFKHLLPTDLLSLGRVSRSFRQLVKSPEFKSVWIESRSRWIPNPPECPEGINEPMFAELAFGAGCLACNRKASRTLRVWQARTRLCTGCVAATFASATFLECLKLPPDIRDMVPTVDVYSRSRAYVGDARVWAEEYHSLKTAHDKDQWERAKLQHLLTLKEHERRCDDWVRKFKGRMAEETWAEENDRKSEIIEMAKADGWEGEILKTRNKTLPYTSHLQKICQKPLTDASVKRARKEINNIMGELQEKRLVAEKKKLLRARMKRLRWEYKEVTERQWKGEGKPPPSVADVFLVPHIRSVVLDTDAEGSIADEEFFTEDTFPIIVEEARAIAREKLFQVIREGYEKMSEGNTVDPVSVLNLATTMFSIKDQPGTFTLTKATDHKTPIKEPEDMQKLDVVEKLALDVFYYGPWNALGTITFDIQGHQIVSALIKMCGLDPLTTTEEELSSVDPIFECLACNSMSEGRMMLRWAGAASHFKSNARHRLNYISKTLKVCTGEDLQKAKQVFEEADERMAYAKNTRMRCKYCPSYGEIHFMRRHLFEEHNVSYPKDKDWTFFDSPPWPKAEECRMWPPHRHSPYVAPGPVRRRAV